MYIPIIYDLLLRIKDRTKDKNQARILWPAYSGSKGKIAITAR